LNQRISVADALLAVDECGAPIVAIAGGEPLLHREMPEITQKILAKGKFIYLCTNALLLEKKIDQYKPHKNFCWDIHLDGDKQMHDKSVDQDGVYERAVDAIKLAKSKGFRVSINCTLFEGADPERVAAFFDTIADLDIDGVMTSPGYAYERAPDQEHFLNRTRTKELFRAIFRYGKDREKNGGKKWKFNQSPLFLDFLAGNQSYKCTPWGNPTRNVFGWQRPCYLLGEGYTKTYKELMETTDWDAYGVGNYEKCADCMVHSGFEATAVLDSVKRPWKMAALAIKGIKTEGAMAKDIPLDKARKADYVFSKHVAEKMAEIHASKNNPLPAE
jgi:hopanoid biosynthesis associated radical SAM protein HpnH